MADISVEQKSSGMTWLWALLAVAAVAGFMFWLYAQSEQIESATAVQGDTAAVAGAAGGTTGEAAELSAIAATPDAFAGRTLQVNGVPVAATVGPRAFWGDVPGQNPFLVVMGDGVQPAGGTLSAGQAYDIVGTVQAVDEAALNQWVQSGAIGEGQREEASFATHVLVAQQATAAAGAAPTPQ